MTVLLSTGGTIGMSGRRAVPVTGFSYLPSQSAGSVTLVEQCSKPSVHLTAADMLGLVERASTIAADGEPVVVTHGTDVMEEVAFLCDLIHAAAAPIVFTGAMKPAGTAGADGPGNVAAALAVAADPTARELGVLVAFAGRVHLAREVRKADSTDLDAFASPHAGAVGTLHADGSLSLARRPARLPALPLPERLAAVEVATVGAGSDGRALHALADVAEGLVVAVPGAGHVPPLVLDAIREIATRQPVILCPRPQRGAILRDTYGFLGSERDLRASGAHCVGDLGAPQARMLLALCLGAGLAAPEALAPIMTAYDQDPRT